MTENKENCEGFSLHAVHLSDIEALIRNFCTKTYYPSNDDEFANKALEKCIQLMKLDYEVGILENTKGELCGQYPAKMPIPENEKNVNQNTGANAPTIYESTCDVEALSQLVKQSRIARTRTRFPVPVILYKGKLICRSSTLAGGPEIYSRAVYNLLFPEITMTNDNKEPPPLPSETEPESTEDVEASEWKPVEWILWDKVRYYDIALLKKYRVKYIVDLMVENKKVKYGLNVTSSEKVDKYNRYSDFQIFGLPYPGCEFFKDYSGNNYEATNLVFNWQQTFIDAHISVPKDHLSSQLNIDWKKYREWDLVLITQNYIKLILKYIHEGSSSILIHCISGWDRTPLFVSLLRISLWADGLIHRNLDAKQILYFTLAYDWYLFSHQLKDRVEKKEDILLFCFHVLKYLTGEEFCMNIMGIRNKKLDSSEKSPPKPEVYNSSSVNIDEPHGDAIGLLLDGDISGSNLSINSIASTVSTKSQDQAASVDDFTNGNSLQNMTLESGSTSANTKSPQSKRTSPVTVPSGRLKQRQDSATPITGSWALVNVTGSYQSNSNLSEYHIQSGRYRRMQAVRETFYRIYPRVLAEVNNRPFYTDFMSTIGNLTGLI